MLVIVTFVAGLAALVLGLFGSTGLSFVGALWIGAAYLGLRHARRLKEQPTLPVVLEGTALYLAAGIPALWVGLARWQVDEGLHWLPLVGGAVQIVFALVTGGMFALGSGIEQASGPAPTLPASLVIVSAAETGTMINERPRLELVLDVTPDGRPTYRVTKKATVPFTALGSIRPGDGFRALVAGPDDPTRMDIDWSSPISRP